MKTSPNRQIDIHLCILRYTTSLLQFLRICFQNAASATEVFRRSHHVSPAIRSGRSFLNVKTKNKFVFPVSFGNFKTKTEKIDISRLSAFITLNLISSTIRLTDLNVHQVLFVDASTVLSCHVNRTCKIGVQCCQFK